MVDGFSQKHVMTEAQTLLHLTLPMLSQSKSFFCCVTANHTPFDVASLHSAILQGIMGSPWSQTQCWSIRRGQRLNSQSTRWSLALGFCLMCSWWRGRGGDWSTSHHPPSNILWRSVWGSVPAANISRSNLCVGYYRVPELWCHFRLAPTHSGTSAFLKSYNRSPRRLISSVEIIFFWHSRRRLS